jgi:hypothetical protein
LTQFDLKFRQIRLPFVDTLDKAHEAVRKINEALPLKARVLSYFPHWSKTELAKVI